MMDHLVTRVWAYALDVERRHREGLQELIAAQDELFIASHRSMSVSAINEGLSRRRGLYEDLGQSHEPAAELVPWEDVTGRLPFSDPASRAPPPNVLRQGLRTEALRTNWAPWPKQRDLTGLLAGAFDAGIVQATWKLKEEVVMQAGPPGPFAAAAPLQFEATPQPVAP